MKRRWKLGIALAVVGLAGFLVWAFNSPPPYPLAIRFEGYRTNGDAYFVTDLNQPPGPLLASFTVSNQTHETLLMAERCLIGTNVVQARDIGIYHIHSNRDYWISRPLLNLSPNAGVLIGVTVRRIDEPVRLTVYGSKPRKMRSRLDEFLSRLPWRNRLHSATATSEPR